MERTKFANGSGHRSVVSRSLPQPEKQRDDAGRSNRGTTLRKKVGRNRKPEKLVCRYCGSSDLAPSFITRPRSPLPQVLRQKVPVSRADQEGEGQEVTAIARLGIGLERARSLFCSTPQTQGRFRSIKVACQFETTGSVIESISPRPMSLK